MAHPGPHYWGSSWEQRLKGHTKLVSNGRVTLADCRQSPAQLAQNALTLSPHCAPQAARDSRAPSTISGVPGTSNNWQRQFHTEESCTVANDSDCDGWRTHNKWFALATAQKSKRSHAHCKSCTAKILLRRVECSSFVLRTSASTLSQCPNGVPKTRMPCSLVFNDWSTLHTTTG